MPSFLVHLQERERVCVCVQVIRITQSITAHSYVYCIQAEVKKGTWNNSTLKHRRSEINFYPILYLYIYTVYILDFFFWHTVVWVRVSPPTDSRLSVKRNWILKIKTESWEMSLGVRLASMDESLFSLENWWKAALGCLSILLLWLLDEYVRRQERIQELNRWIQRARMARDQKQFQALLSTMSMSNESIEKEDNNGSKILPSATETTQLTHQYILPLHT